MQSKRSLFWAGVRAEAPLLIAVFPFGMIYGALAMNAGLSVPEAQSMSWMVFGGSSQFIAAQLLHEAVPAVVILLTIAVVNLRHMLYSASVARYLVSLSPKWKTLLAYLLTDEAYAVVITHYDEEGQTPSSHWFFLGAGLALWSTWQVSTAFGITLGTVIPESWPLDFALPLTFIAIVMPELKDRATVAAALVAGSVAVLGNDIPYRLGLILAALVGITAGLLLERRK
jgi:4-azaleucine resistance transporter AzlC